MKTKLLLSGLMVSALFSTQASAELITIYTGGLTGNYHNVIGKSLKKELEKKGHMVTLVNSNGSVDNINKVNKVSNAIGIAQADVARDLIDNDEKFENVGMNGNLGYECGFFVVRADGKDEFSEFKGKKIAAGKKGSGTLFTYHNLAKMNPDMLLPKIKTKGGKRYIGKVDNKSYGGYFFMNMPDPKNAQISDVVENEKLDFLPMHDLELGELGIGDDPVYTKVSVPVKKGFFNGKTKRSADAICTHATLVVDEEETKEALLNDIYDASKKVKTESQTAYGFASSWVNKAKDAVKNIK